MPRAGKAVKAAAVKSKRPARPPAAKAAAAKAATVAAKPPIDRASKPSAPKDRVTKVTAAKRAPAKPAKRPVANAKKAPPAKAKPRTVAKRAPAKTAKAPAKAVAPKPAPSKPAKVAPAKPVPAKAVKAPPAPKPVKPKAPRKPTAAMLKFFERQRETLLEDRATYTHQAELMRREAEQLAEEMEPGDIQFDEESGEGATMNVERERDLTLSAQASAAVDEIDRALAKIDAGTYGLCEQCGQPIVRARLEALPYAALCVACKSGGLSRR